MVFEGTPTVSIICTVYNKARWLRQTIESFLIQKDVDFEIILIDDASTDNSRDIIQQFSKAYPDKIHAFYNHENIGIVKTWQRACSVARGRYIARCDGDDFWLDEYKLAKQVDVLDNNLQSKWCGTDINFVDVNGLTTANKVFGNRVINLADTYEKMIATRGFTAPSTWLVDRELMLKVNDMLQEDSETADDTFNLQLDLFHQTDFTFLPDVTVAYRVNEGSDSRPQSFEALQKRFDSLLNTQLYYLDKYPDTDYKKILQLLLSRHNDFDKELSQKQFSHSKVNSQKVTIFSKGADEEFSQEKVIEFPLQNKDSIVFELSEDTDTLRIDLSEVASFYQRVSLIVSDTGTELLPNYTNGDIIGNYVMFKQEDPQLIYDLSTIQEKSFVLNYEMFNVDDIQADDYIAKILTADLQKNKHRLMELEMYKVQYQIACDEGQTYKKQLEEMIVRYNSVTHSRRWTIPTRIINFFRRNK